MRALAEFEGIVGFRWGALLSPEGELQLSGTAPAQAAKQVTFIHRLLQMAPVPIGAAEFVFDRGKVVFRIGDYGLLLLFCDLSVSHSMLILLLDAFDREDSSVLASPTMAQHESGNQTPLSDTLLSGHSTINLVVKGDGQKVPTEIIDELVLMYTEVLGPLAPVLAKRELEKAGLSLADVAASDWAKVLNLLANRISDSIKHERFLDRAVMLKARF